MVVRLNFAVPPPGFAAWKPLPSGRPADDRVAWGAYKAANDPPGMVTSGPMGRAQQWTWTLLSGVEHPHVWCDTQDVARAAAWSWYEVRIKLADTLDVATDHGAPVWPRCLAWSDEEVATVKLWMADSLAELPPVLIGAPKTDEYTAMLRSAVDRPIALEIYERFERELDAELERARTAMCVGCYRCVGDCDADTKPIFPSVNCERRRRGLGPCPHEPQCRHASLVVAAALCDFSAVLHDAGVSMACFLVTTGPDGLTADAALRFNAAEHGPVVTEMSNAARGVAVQVICGEREPVFETIPNPLLLRRTFQPKHGTAERWDACDCDECTSEKRKASESPC